MNPGARLTIGIAAAVIAAATFPLLGLIVGVFVAGMGVHSALSHQPNFKKGRVGDDAKPLDILEDYRNASISAPDRHRRSRK